MPNFSIEQVRLASSLVPYYRLLCYGITAFSFYVPTDFCFMAIFVGIEPTTYCLKYNCSTIEPKNLFDSRCAVGLVL